MKRVQQRDDSGIFARLRSDVIGKYIEPNENGILGWSLEFLARVARGGAKPGPAKMKLVVCALFSLWPFK